MEQNPILSVITPCYNAERFVAETIESVLNQTSQNHEHIIVDDGSTDRSWEIIQSYVTRYPDRIRAQRQEHFSGARARNRGAELARGKYFHFLDADDLVLPHTYAAVIKGMAGQNDRLGFTGWEFYQKIGNDWVVQSVPGKLAPSDGDYLDAFLRRKIFVVTCALYWPRELFEKVGGWDDSITAYDDMDLVFRTLMENPGGIFIPEAVSRYRRHGSDHVPLSVNTKSTVYFKSSVTVMDRIVARLRSSGRLEGYALPMARNYYRLACRYVGADWNLAVECDRKALELGGLQAIPKGGGRRIAHGLMGFKGKQRIKDALRMMGVSDARREQWYRRFILREALD